MEGVVAIAALVTGIAGLIAAGGAIWLAVLNRQLVKAGQDQAQVSHELLRASQDQVRASQEQVKASQDEVRVSQEQVKVSQEQVRAAQEQLIVQQRPVLVPVGLPKFQLDNTNWLDWSQTEQPLAIRNVGSGTAFNVASVLYGCASYLHDSPIGRRLRDASSAHEHWTCWLGVPIAVGEQKPGEQEESHTGSHRSVVVCRFAKARVRHGTSLHPSERTGYDRAIQEVLRWPCHPTTLLACTRS